jgi:SulP family sulfate permease
LVAVVVGVIYSFSTGYTGAIVGDVPDVVLPPLELGLPWGALPGLVVSGGIIAMVGFAEAASVSQTFAEQTRTTWNPNKEFVSQGVANLAAGIFGGFPVGGSFSRSALNRHAGARSRWSGAITGVTVLAFLPFAAVISPLPKAVLGAIVVGAVLKLLDPRPLIDILRASKPQALVGFATFALTLLLAPHVEYAVLAGISIALAIHAWREMSVDVAARREEEMLVLEPRGVIWFASAPLFRQRMGELLAEHADANRVTIDLSGLGRVDLTGASMLRSVARGAADSGMEVRVCHASRQAQKLLGRVLPEWID